MSANTPVSGDGGEVGTAVSTMSDAGSGPSPTRRARRPKDEVVASILDAADRLFAERSPSAVSLREIAEVAGVQHSLIHRHFGTKDELLRAVVDRASRRFRDALVGEDPVEVALAGYRYMIDHPTLIRVMLRCVLDGEDPRRYMTSTYAYSRLIELGADPAEREAAPTRSTTDATSATDRNVDPTAWPAGAAPEGVAVLGAFSIGAVVAEPWLRAADGMGDVTSAQFRAAMERSIGTIVEQFVVPPRDA